MVQTSMIMFRKFHVHLYRGVSVVISTLHYVQLLFGMLTHLILDPTKPKCGCLRWWKDRSFSLIVFRRLAGNVHPPPLSPIMTEILPAFSQVWLQEPQLLQVLEDADIDIHNKATFLGRKPSRPPRKIWNFLQATEKKQNSKKNTYKPWYVSFLKGFPVISW